MHASSLPISSNSGSASPNQLVLGGAAGGGAGAAAGAPSSSALKPTLNAARTAAALFATPSLFAQVEIARRVTPSSTPVTCAFPQPLSLSSC
jgi:hypothetical protein